jgi:hypothetical protein
MPMVTASTSTFAGAWRLLNLFIALTKILLFFTEDFLLGFAVGIKIPYLFVFLLLMLIKDLFT